MLSFFLLGLKNNFGGVSQGAQSGKFHVLPLKRLYQMLIVLFVSVTIGGIWAVS